MMTLIGPSRRIGTGACSHGMTTSWPRRHKDRETGIPFGGVIYAHQLRVSIGRCVQDLEIIAKAGEPEDLMNGVMFLPL